MLLYAGHFDASGKDIDRDFQTRTECWDEVVRVALNDAQIDAYGLRENPGKETDSRAWAFERRHARSVQVELDALPPDDLQGLLTTAFDRYWDASAFAAVVAREAAERAELARLAEAS